MRYLTGEHAWLLMVGIRQKTNFTADFAALPAFSADSFVTL
jgi:hypothetical protein